MILYHYIDYDFCKSWNINGDLDLLILNNFCELVNNDKD